MRKQGDNGVTLIELLVVMLVVGVLSSIAIPAFASQKARARDAATQSDVVNLGQEIATYYVDGEGVLTLDIAVRPGVAVLSDGTWSTSVELTKGTAVPASGGESNLHDPHRWCVSLTDPQGDAKEYRYSATSGLEAGTC